MLGDVGSEHSLSFTVIGDTVNTASRLQGLTRTLETPLVVGDALVSAVAALPPGIAAELLGALEDQGEQALRGRTGPVRIWTRVPPPRLPRVSSLQCQFALFLARYPHFRPAAPAINRPCTGLSSRIRVTACMQPNRRVRSVRRHRAAQPA